MIPIASRPAGRRGLKRCGGPLAPPTPLRAPTRTAPAPPLGGGRAGQRWVALRQRLAAFQGCHSQFLPETLGARNPETIVQTWNSNHGPTAQHGAGSAHFPQAAGRRQY